MNIETIKQAYIFLMFIINGILIGVIFDIFRILRKSFKTSNLITYLEDIIFWIIVTIIIMYSIFSFNNGQFRGYIFLGIFLGTLIYMLFCSRIIINISVKLISILKNIIIFVIRIIIFPLKFIYKFFSKEKLKNKEGI